MIDDRAVTSYADDLTTKVEDIFAQCHQTQRDRTDKIRFVVLKAFHTLLEIERRK